MVARLGRFEIKAEIGRGGFGQVFCANDPVMNRVVAVKVLTATEDSGSFNRFKNEATAAGNLHHENIVTVYEFGQEGQVPFLVMEYLNGEDLQQVIKRQAPLTLYQKLRIMDQVADGLQCAHRNGVLHRDVKPANIMVLDEGAVKIMDFGIARLMRDTSPRLTQRGYLIGTVVYMAPELFADTELEVDALCDIWSYGVVLYELLAGKNPFQTGSLQSEMYRVVHHEPPPLPASDCPADLQAILNKLLSKKRESRYQSLEDTRFDLEPILKNLEKAEADRLVSNARQLMFQQQLDEALSEARKARKLNPQSSAARVIFERIQDEKRKQSLQPRIDDLLVRSDEAAKQRNISEAIVYLNEALKLDSSNEQVLARLQELRNLKARLEAAARLFREAGAEFHDGRLTEAFSHASEAVSHDPGNPEARQLLESIHGALQTRESERALEAEVLRVRGLIAINDLDGAMETLRSAKSKYPARAETGELEAKVAQLLAQRDERLDYSRRLNQAKDLVRTGRFEDAVKQLDQLLESFPNEVEARDLLAYVRQELRAKKREEEVKRIANAAAELNGNQNFVEAIGIIEGGLKDYPDELALTRLLRSTHVALQDFERKQSLQAGLDRCEELRGRGRWREALDLIALLNSDNPTDPDLRELAAKVRQDKIRAERTAAIQDATEQAGKLLEDGRTDLAISVIEGAIHAVGGELELAPLLKKAKEAQQSERDRQYIETELKHSRVFEERGDFPTSLKIIDDALRRFPKSPELLAARQHLSAPMEHFSKAGTSGQPGQEAAASAATIEALLTRKEWAQAREKLDTARKLFPTESVFAKLDEELRRRRIDHCDPLVREGRRLLEAGEVAEAEQFLSANLLDYCDIPDVMKFGSDILAGKKLREQQKEIAECLRVARDLESKNDLIGAQDTLMRGLDRHPHDSALTSAQLKLRDRIQRDVRIQKPTHEVEVGDHQLQPASKWRIYGIAGVALAALVGLAIWLLHPTIRITPEKLSFAYKSGTGPEAQKITVTGSNDIPDPTPSESWVRLTRHNIGPGKVEFLVAVSTDGLGTGPHAADLIFPSQKVYINLLVPSATIEFRPASLIFSYSPAGIPLQKIVVTSPTDIPDPKPSERWVTFTRHNLGLGKAEFAVRVFANGLAPGPHTATLAFPGDKKVPVELMIPGGSTIEVYPASLAFPEGGPQQRVIVTGPGVLPDPKPSEPWITVTRANVGPGKTEFLVQASAEGLEPGKKSGSLVFSADRKVQVELTVPAGPPLEVQPDSLAFPSGGAQQTISVTGPAPIPDPTTTDPWVTFSRRDPGPGKAEFVVQASSKGLAIGPHVAYLVFDPQKQVRIELMVKPVEVQPAELRFKYKRGGPPPQPQVITATGPPDIPDPSKKAAWIQLTRTNSGTKTEFAVQILPDKLGPDVNTDDLIFSPQKKVRVEATMLDAAEDAPAPSGTIFWSGGTLNPGDELWIKEKRILKGPGSVNGRLPKADLAIDKSKLPASLRVLEEPSRDNAFVLRLLLVSGPPVYYLGIPWSLKK